MTEEAGFRYRPGLDGVRALAVAAVILYHGEVSWAKGGFLGVDVFFVLSGFLITALLLAEHDRTGGIGLTAFWARRARRLIPALFLVLAGVALYAVVWAQPTELGTIRGDGLASLFYVSNWKFIADGSSYFQAFQAPSPLTHTWSLAIEEQWYLFWPLVVLLMLNVLRASRRVFVVVLVGLTLSSAGLMAFLFHPGTDPSRVYYGTDTRAQSLLVGATFAALTAGRMPILRLDRLRRPWILQVAGAIGGTVVAVMVVRADAAGTFLYRGAFLLVAIAAVLFVGAASVDGPIAACLSIRPLVAIGMISYGLYLWHWPIDVVLDETRTGLDGFALFALRIAVTGAIATASYWLVERPIRRNAFRARRSRARVRAPVLITLSAVAVVAVLLLVATQGAVSEPTLASIAKANQRALRNRDPRRTRILFLGDSQVLSLATYGAPEFAGAGSQYLFKPIFGCGVFDRDEHIGDNCEQRAPTWRSAVRTFNPDLSVLLVGAWETQDFSLHGETFVHATPAHERELTSIVAHAIHPLLTRHGRVALLEAPCFQGTRGGAGTLRPRNDPNSVTDVNDALRAVARREPRRVVFVPWADAICPGGHYAAKVDGITVRPDGVHVGNAAGAKIVTDRIVPVLRGLARDARAARS